MCGLTYALIRHPKSLLISIYSSSDLRWREFVSVMHQMWCHFVDMPPKYLGGDTVFVGNRRIECVGGGGGQTWIIYEKKSPKSTLLAGNILQGLRTTKAQTSHFCSSPYYTEGRKHFTDIEDLNRGKKTIHRYSRLKPREENNSQ